MSATHLTIRNSLASTSADERAAVSVVVPAYNASATISGCLRALLQQDFAEPYEIIVVDDGSTDSTSCEAGRYSPRVLVLRQAHRGPAAARNLGIESASGNIVLFTDADCEPVPGWATALVSAIRGGAAGAKGTYRTRQTSITARFVQAEYESKYRRMARRARIDFIDTYSAAYRRDVLVEAGCFNETLTVDEDQELSFRLAERGYDLRFVPEAVVYHTHAPTPWRYALRKARIGYWKVQVAALHPGRIVSDSHTPPSIKAQMLLLVAGLASALFSLFSSAARKTVVACCLGFLASTLPFSARILRRDPLLSLATPGMMLLRAGGLSVGVLLGLRRFGKGLARSVAYATLKRGMDLALSSIGLVAASPVMGMVAVAIKVDSRGPICFAQLRAGRGGKPFRMYKFRTMVDRAEEMRAGLVEARGLEEPVLKLYPDPRVTRTGRFLRRWSLDELPQLLNVLKGEMSLVGPRPEELRVVRMYSPWQRQRLQATPGITGPMQVGGRAELSLDERVRVELDYIERASILEDLKILARTVRTVLSGEGSY